MGLQPGVNLPSTLPSQEHPVSGVAEASKGHEVVVVALLRLTVSREKFCFLAQSKYF